MTYRFFRSEDDSESSKCGKCRAANFRSISQYPLLLVVFALFPHRRAQLRVEIHFGSCTLLGWSLLCRFYGDEQDLEELRTFLPRLHHLFVSLVTSENILQNIVLKEVNG